MLAWTFGILIGVAGLASLGSSLFGGLCLIACSLLLLPPSRSLIAEKTGRDLPVAARTALITVLLVVAGFSMPAQDALESNVAPRNQAASNAQPVRDPALERQAARAKAVENMGSMIGLLEAMNPEGVGQDLAAAQMTVVIFSESAKAVQDMRAYAPLTTEESAMAISLRQLLIRRQEEAFPRLRQAAAKGMDEKLWESDVDVSVSGTRSRTVTFVGGMFAANRNIATAREALAPLLTQMRFQRADFKWIPSADEWSYYDLENPADEDLAIVTAEGAVTRVDTDWLNENP